MLQTRKFIVVEDGFTLSGEVMVILSDYKFWAQHTEELDGWCLLHQYAARKGMAVLFQDVATLTAFLLRWT